jgi:hypothetical protein
MKLNTLIYRALRAVLRFNDSQYGRGASCELLRDLAGEWREPYTSACSSNIWERCTSHRSCNGCELQEGHAGKHQSGGLTWY